MEITDKEWHLVTKSRGGVVSFIRNLSLSDALQVSASLDPWRGMAGTGQSQMRMCSDSDIDMREILGPSEWDGCTKAMKHSYGPEKITLCDGGPNIGRTYRTANCCNCGHMLFEWLDDKKEEAPLTVSD